VTVLFWPNAEQFALLKLLVLPLKLPLGACAQAAKAESASAKPIGYVFVTCAAPPFI
jgi:hypothetical protein